MFARYAHLAKATRAGCQAIGLTLFPDPNCATNVLTAVNVPAALMEKANQDHARYLWNYLCWRSRPD